MIICHISRLRSHSSDAKGAKNAKGITLQAPSGCPVGFPKPVFLPEVFGGRWLPQTFSHRLLQRLAPENPREALGAVVSRDLQVEEHPQAIGLHSFSSSQERFDGCEKWNDSLLNQPAAVFQGIPSSFYLSFPVAPIACNPCRGNQETNRFRTGEAF